MAKYLARICPQCADFFGVVLSADRKAWQSGTPKDWANESIAINTRYVYSLPENHEISEEYAKRALPIVAQAFSAGGCAARVVAQ